MRSQLRNADDVMQRENLHLSSRFRHSEIVLVYAFFRPAVVAVPRLPVDHRRHSGASDFLPHDIPVDAQGDEPCIEPGVLGLLEIDARRLIEVGTQNIWRNEVWTDDRPYTRVVNRLHLVESDVWGENLLEHSLVWLNKN